MSEPVDPQSPLDEELADLDPADPEPEEAGNSALRSFLGLFIVPLLVVLLCVAIFIGFGWIAYDRQSTRDYLGDLESGWKPRRVQAAYELSKILVSDPRALDKEPGAKAQVRRLFQEADDPEMRRYLALVLGRTGDRETLTLLIDAVEDGELRDCRLPPCCNPSRNLRFPSGVPSFQRSCRRSFRRALVEVSSHIC